MIKPRRMRWGWHVGNMGKGDHLEDLGVDGKTILKWLFKKYEGRSEMGLSSTCEDCNEPSVVI
jgi:hypothetical protein